MIVLIEPDAELRRVYSEALGREHEITAVSDAEQAIHTIDEQAPSLVIMELQLPRHNGIEFLQELRSYPEWQHIRVLIHTMVSPRALSLTESMRQQYGIDHVLYKPATTLKKLLSVAGQFA